MGMQDKFNEMKDKVTGDNDDLKKKAEGLKDQADDTFNKVKESPMGDKAEEMTNNVKEKAQEAVSKMKGRKGPR